MALSRQHRLDNAIVKHGAPSGEAECIEAPAMMTNDAISFRSNSSLAIHTSSFVLEAKSLGLVSWFLAHTRTEILERPMAATVRPASAVTGTKETRYVSQPTICDCHRRF
jgi:hypothetical protein